MNTMQENMEKQSFRSKSELERLNAIYIKSSSLMEQFPNNIDVVFAYQRAYEDVKKERKLLLENRLIK